ncbi:MAG: hypothetical protein MZV64_09710 [Ignavibacteriales bacterium]|nr:hypothetical protein [Ignavibacteriales bacterium]
MVNFFPCTTVNPVRRCAIRESGVKFRKGLRRFRRRILLRRSAWHAGARDNHGSQPAPVRRLSSRPLGRGYARKLNVED